MTHLVMAHEEDPKEKISREIGDTSGFVLLNNQILLATYIRPQKTKSGLYISDKYLDEDKYQSKVGLLIAKGPSAFDDKDGEWFGGRTFKVGEWLVFRPSDGWNVSVNGVACKILSDTQVKGIVDSPDRVW